MINDNLNWEMIDIFIDIGKSGLRTKNRDAFNKMISLAKRKNIDMILVKSVSRLARNTINLLEIVRVLRGIGVHFYFEIEGMSTETDENDMVLTILVAFAQEEIKSLSYNTAWGIRTKMKLGEYKMRKVYGYNVKNNELVINESEATVVRMIFNLYYDSHIGARKIVKILEELEILSPGGCRKWNTKTVMEIIKNELYVGDVILQKTYTSDYLTGERKRNEGQLDKIIYKDNHKVIIDKNIFDKANDIRLSREFGAYKDNQFKPQFALSRVLKCAEWEATIQEEKKEER